MSSMTFLINDTADANAPVVRVVIAENADGTVSFTLSQLAGYAGDLRGLFFDVADVSLIGTLVVSGTGVTDYEQGNDSIVDMGGGSNINGLLGKGQGFDVGVEIGTSGIGTDDYRTVSFTVDSTLRNLTLADFSCVKFGARLTSVGMDSNLDGTFETSRTGSSKTGEVTFGVATATADAMSVAEDTTATGNVLSNDGGTVSDTLSVTSWSGGALGVATSVTQLAGATVRLNADGTYEVDASAADQLAVGQSASHVFTYDVLQTNVDGTSTQTVSFTVTITGTNDAPTVAAALTGSAAEGAGSFTQDLLAGAGDADDGEAATLQVSGVTYSVDGGAASATAPAGFSRVGSTLTVDPADAAFNHLAVGAQTVVVVGYSVQDAQGATVAQSATLTITGTNDAPTVSPGATATGSVTEDTNVSGTGTLGSTGTITFDDADLADGHTVVVTPAGTNTLDGSLSAIITTAATGAGAGTVAWTFSLSNAAVQSLGAGDHPTESFEITVSDGNGGTTSQTVSVTINGADEAPSGPTDDTLTGGATNDTYLVGLADGHDTIVDAGGGQDALQVATAASDVLALLNFEQVGANLLIKVGATELTVSNSAGSGRIESVTFTNGGTYAGYTIGTSAYNLGGNLGGTGQQDVIASSALGQALTGLGGNDMLFGNGGDDNINSAAGADLLVAGLGNDTLTGGTGNDVFLFNTALNAATNVDSLVDFNANAADRISLSLSVFSALGAAGMLAGTELFVAATSGTGGTANAGGAHLVYDPNGKLYYDADGGDGTSGRTLFAQVTLTGTLDNTDFLVIA